MSTTTLEVGPILRAMKRSKTRFGLIVLEVALSLAIVANCVTLILDARRSMARPSGFDDQALISVRSAPFDPAFREAGYLDNGVKQDLELLRSLPGVRAATNSRFLPWQGGGSSFEVRPQGSKGEMLRTQVYNADEGTFATLGVEVVEGRDFTREEVERETLRLRELFNAPRPQGADGRRLEPFSQDVVISRALARLAFGEGSALGKLLEDNEGDTYRVVGIIDRFYNPYGWPIHEYVVFFPATSRSFEGGAPYLLRAEAGRTSELVKAVEERLLAANDGRNLRVRTITEIKRGFFGQQRFLVTAMTIVIVLLVLVASLGIVGLTSFSVTERTRQIGTRRALGARRRDILRYFLLENWLLTSLGLGIGCVLAYGLNVALMSAVSEARLSGGLLAAGVLLLWAAGLIATLAPARRAARISPAIATRNV